MNIEKRVIRVKGATAYDAGFELGRRLKSRLNEHIQRYLSERPTQPIDREMLREQALPYLRQLPVRFVDEYKGLADGSDMSLQCIAEWAFLETFLMKGCSSFLCRIDGHVYIGHNNDTFVPDMWGYVTVREIAGRIPVMCFGLEGDVWTTAGVNQSRLWLHVDHLSVSDTPDKSNVCLPTYGFLVEALETCETLNDVEKLLQQIDREDGMLLVAVDGKADEAAVFECSCKTAVRCDYKEQWLVRTNHAFEIQDATGPPTDRPLNTWSRFARLEELLTRQYANSEPDVSDLIRFLADDGVERREKVFATAYSTVACVNRGEIWYTFGGFPAASSGHWARIPFPW